MITLRQFKAGEFIFRESDEGETAYIIERGLVEVTQQSEGQEIHLASLGTGEIFGEMSLLEERPRCATVKAVEETMVREIPRAELSQSLHSDPQTILNLIRVLFERLREANSTILQLQKDAPLACHLPNLSLSRHTNAPTNVVQLEALTHKAASGLPSNPFEISKFPFRIGRQSHDPLVTNDLMIPDSEPYQISIHHIAFVQGTDGIGVVDRGSRLGSLLNGTQLGGTKGEAKPIFLSETDSILVLGHTHSQYKYKLSLHK